MKKIAKNLLIFLLLLCGSLTATQEFGYISYSMDGNAGDDIQSIAALQFLPKDSVPVDREFISTFKSDGIVNTIVNGWFMHTKNHGVGRDDLPETSWPPSPSIKPLLISIHLTKAFLPEAFSKEGIKYFKENGPVGARDLCTLREFKDRGIPAYYSGCLTLTLNNPHKNKKRNNIVYVVDLDNEIYEYVKKQCPNSEVIKLTHNIPGPMRENRLEVAQSLLSKYYRAKCVVTRRFHAAMPCLALETPVLLIGHQNDYRFRGIIDLVRNCSKSDLLNGKYDFDFENPTPNPKDYLPIRENLINIVTAWRESLEK